MATTQFDVSELLKGIDEQRRRASNLEPFWKGAESILVEAVDYEFDSEGRGKWKKSLRAELQGGKTLQDTGLGAGSIKATHGKDFVEAGTNVWYMVFHLPPEKSGHPVTTGIMPVRDYLDVDEEEVFDELVDLLLAHLVPG